MEKIKFTVPEPTFSDRMTIQKDITARSLPSVIRGDEYAVCLNQVMTFGGDINRFRQYLEYGKDLGVSTISNEGIACINFYWTTLPQDMRPNENDICLVKPFIVHPDLDKVQVILHERKFVPLTPKRYLTVLADPNVLALELYQDER